MSWRNGHNSTLRPEQLDFDLFSLSNTPPPPAPSNRSIAHSLVCQGTGKSLAKVRRHVGAGVGGGGGCADRKEEGGQNGGSFRVIYLSVCLCLFKARSVF